MSVSFGLFRAKKPTTEGSVMSNNAPEQLPTKAGTSLLIRVGPVVLVYVLATLLTDAYYVGDAPDYVDSVVAYASGRDYWFWEFGHLMLRPTGWMLLVLLKPLTSLFLGEDVRDNANFALLLLNWVAGLVGVLSLYGLVSRFCQRRWVVYVAVIAYIFSHGFLNYVQSGCAYIPAQALLMLGLYLLARGGDNPASATRTALLAGLALGAAVCMWFPFVLAMPAAVAAPLFLYGAERWRWRLTLLTGVTAGLVIGLVYLSVMVGALGIYDIAGLRAWMARTVGGPAQDKAVQRMVFGFARSFIYMGNDGPLFKRYLVGDPFNPVGLADLFRLSLWKLTLFYLFLASVVLGLLRSPLGRRVLGLLALNAAPIIGLAVFWQGGDIERYFALYPVIFLSLAVSLSTDRAPALSKYVSLTFVVAMILSSATAMAKLTLDARQEVTAARASDLQSLLRLNSRVFTVTFTDDLVNFKRAFPFHPVNRGAYINPVAIIALGTTQVPVWRQDFATKAEETWGQGGDVWVSRRVLSQRPRPEWNWVEGDDKNVSWADVPSFFSKLEMGQSVGGEDGFFLLPPSEKNRAFLGEAARQGKRP